MKIHIVRVDQLLTYRVRHYDVYVTDALLASQAFPESFGQFTDSVSVRYKLVPAPCKRYRMIDTLEKKAAELILELFYLKRDRRL